LGPRISSHRKLLTKHLWAPMSNFLIHMSLQPDGENIFHFQLWLNTTTFIPNLAYARFGIISTQFYVNFSTQEHQIDFFYGIVQKLRTSAFILYPLSFFLYCPFKIYFNSYNIGLQGYKDSKIVWGSVHFIIKGFWFKGVMQGKLIAVVYTLRTYWNQFSLGGICKQ